MTRSVSTEQHGAANRSDGRGSSAGQNDITSITATRHVWHWFTCRSLVRQTMARILMVQAQLHVQQESLFICNKISQNKIEEDSHDEFFLLLWCNAFRIQSILVCRCKGISTSMDRMRYAQSMFRHDNYNNKWLFDRLFESHSHFFASSNHRDSIAHIQVFFHTRRVAQGAYNKNGWRNEKKSGNESFVASSLPFQALFHHRVQFQSFNHQPFLMGNWIERACQKRQRVTNEMKHWIDVIENVGHREIACNCKQQPLR